MYDKDRPSIPVEIRRAVLVRAGHKCEIANCHERTYTQIHHIDFNRENNAVDNLIVLCEPHHRMAHEKKIDRKSLKMYIVHPNQTFIHSEEVKRVQAFLDSIKLCLTEYGNGYPEWIDDGLYYFFRKSVYEEILSFLDSGKYQREFKSFDSSVNYKQDQIVRFLTEIINSVTFDKYLDIGSCFKLAANHPYGECRDSLIEFQEEFVNSRLRKIFSLYHELDEYCLQRF